MTSKRESKVNEILEHLKSEGYVVSITDEDELDVRWIYKDNKYVGSIDWFLNKDAIEVSSGDDRNKYIENVFIDINIPDLMDRVRQALHSWEEDPNEIDLDKNVYYHSAIRVYRTNGEFVNVGMLVASDSEWRLVVISKWDRAEAFLGRCCRKDVVEWVEKTKVELGRLEFGFYDWMRRSYGAADLIRLSPIYPLLGGDIDSATQHIRPHILVEGSEPQNSGGVRVGGVG